MTGLHKFLPRRRVIVLAFAWLGSLFLAAYAGGYWALRKTEVFSLEYPVEFLEGHFGMKCADVTLTRNNAYEYDPIAEVRGWSVKSIPSGGDVTWWGRSAVRFFSPAIFLETRFRKNRVTDEQEQMSGRLPSEISVEAIRARLRRDTGLDFSGLTHGSGRYWHHFADGWGVTAVATMEGGDIAPLIARLREHGDYEAREFKEEKYSKQYHFAHKSNDEEHEGGWSIGKHFGSITISWSSSYSDR